MRQLRRAGIYYHLRMSGRSSVVEHNLAKVGVESSNLFARSNFPSVFRRDISLCRQKPHSCLL